MPSPAASSGSDAVTTIVVILVLVFVVVAGVLVWRQHRALASSEPPVYASVSEDFLPATTVETETEYSKM